MLTKSQFSKFSKSSKLCSIALIFLVLSKYYSWKEFAVKGASLGISPKFFYFLFEKKIENCFLVLIQFLIFKLFQSMNEKMTRASIHTPDVQFQMSDRNNSKPVSFFIWIVRSYYLFNVFNTEEWFAILQERCLQKSC